MAKLDWQRPKYAWERISDEDYLLKQPKSGLPRKPPPMRDPNEEKKKLEEKKRRKIAQQNHNRLMKTPIGMLYQKKYVIRAKAKNQNMLTTYVQVQFEREIEHHIRVTRSTLEESYCMHIGELDMSTLHELGLVLKVQIYQYQIVYDIFGDTRTRGGFTSASLYVIGRTSYISENSNYGLCNIERIGIHNGNGQWHEDVQPTNMQHIFVSDIKNLLQQTIQVFFRDTRLNRDDRFEIDNSGNFTPYGFCRNQEKEESRMKKAERKKNKKDKVRIRFVLWPYIPPR